MPYVVDTPAQTLATYQIAIWGRVKATAPVGNEATLADVAWPCFLQASCGLRQQTLFRFSPAPEAMAASPLARARRKCQGRQVQGVDHLGMDLPRAKVATLGCIKARVT